jgi:2-(1,2-epoxy-1,2-dihydrophenyl)acetyl-CoA isomerase
MVEGLLESRRDGVALLSFNRPDRMNALSAEIGERLLAVLPALADDPEIGAIVMTGEGRAFSAGGDVKTMTEPRERYDAELEDMARSLRRRMEIARLLHESPLPTIAMIRGPAVGAGFSLALACDLRIGGESARLGTAFARVGYSGDYGGSYFLTRLVGPAKARELYFTAELLDAQRALALGLLNRVVPDAELERETLGLASRLAAGPRIAFSYMKKNLNAAETRSLAEVLDLEAWHHTRCGQSEEHREAARAFAEKRDPIFRRKPR